MLQYTQHHDPAKIYKKETSEAYYVAVNNICMLSSLAKNI